ncbi:MAG: TRAP-type C4-dicarboxylate transport system substrate-binding protein [Polyangiales bacterium]|jgi:TRAP-type C4-dicarboxylate transport system substrate-binding protein
MPTSWTRTMAAAAGAAGLLLALGSGAGAQGPHELNIGSLAPKGTPWMDMLEKMETLIEKESGGRINVILRPPGVMGEVEMVRETRRGERLQACAVTTAALAEGGNIPQLSIIELPFLFASNAEADHVLDSVLFDHFDGVLGRRGFVLGLWSENGWRSFGTKGEAIRKPADLKKFKMRSQESDVHMAMYKAFGGQAVQKPMTEVLTALQSNVIDGLDNTALYIQAGGLAEPLDYFTLSRHIYQPAAIVYSKSWFGGLEPDLQAVLRKPKELTASGRAAIRAEEAEMVATMEVFDVEVIELTEADRKAFSDVAKAMHSSYAASVDGGSDVLGMVQAALAQTR